MARITSIFLTSCVFVRICSTGISPFLSRVLRRFKRLPMKLLKGIHQLLCEEALNHLRLSHWSATRGGASKSSRFHCLFSKIVLGDPLTSCTLLTYLYLRRHSPGAGCAGITNELHPFTKSSETGQSQSTFSTALFSGICHVSLCVYY